MVEQDTNFQTSSFFFFLIIYFSFVMGGQKLKENHKDGVLVLHARLNKPRGSHKKQESSSSYSSYSHSHS